MGKDPAYKIAASPLDSGGNAAAKPVFVEFPIAGNTPNTPVSQKEKQKNEPMQQSAGNEGIMNWIKKKLDDGLFTLENTAKSAKNSFQEKVVELTSGEKAASKLRDEHEAERRAAKAKEKEKDKPKNQNIDPSQNGGQGPVTIYNQQQNTTNAPIKAETKQEQRAKDQTYAIAQYGAIKDVEKARDDAAKQQISVPFVNGRQSPQFETNNSVTIQYSLPKAITDGYSKELSTPSATPIAITPSYKDNVVAPVGISRTLLEAAGKFQISSSAESPKINTPFVNGPDFKPNDVTYSAQDKVYTAAGTTTVHVAMDQKIEMSPAMRAILQSVQTQSIPVPNTYAAPHAFSNPAIYNPVMTNPSSSLPAVMASANRPYFTPIAEMQHVNLSAPLTNFGGGARDLEAKLGLAQGTLRSTSFNQPQVTTTPAPSAFPTMRIMLNNSQLTIPAAVAEAPTQLPNYATRGSISAMYTTTSAEQPAPSYLTKYTGSSSMSLGPTKEPAPKSFSDPLSLTGLVRVAQDGAIALKAAVLKWNEPAAASSYPQALKDAATKEPTGVVHQTQQLPMSPQVRESGRGNGQGQGQNSGQNQPNLGEISAHNTVDAVLKAAVALNPRVMGEQTAAYAGGMQKAGAARELSTPIMLSTPVTREYVTQEYGVALRQPFPTNPAQWKATIATTSDGIIVVSQGVATGETHTQRADVAMMRGGNPVFSGLSLAALRPTEVGVAALGGQGASEVAQTHEHALVDASAARTQAVRGYTTPTQQVDLANLKPYQVASNSATDWAKLGISSVTANVNGAPSVTIRASMGQPIMGAAAQTTNTPPADAHVDMTSSMRAQVSPRNASVDMNVVPARIVQASPANLQSVVERASVSVQTAIIGQVSAGTSVRFSSEAPRVNSMSVDVASMRSVTQPSVANSTAVHMDVQNLRAAPIAQLSVSAQPQALASVQSTVRPLELGALPVMNAATPMSANGYQIKGVAISTTPNVNAPQVIETHSVTLTPSSTVQVSARLGMNASDMTQAVSVAPVSAARVNAQPVDVGVSAVGSRSANGIRADVAAPAPHEVANMPTMSGLNRSISAENAVLAMQLMSKPNGRMGMEGVSAPQASQIAAIGAKSVLNTAQVLHETTLNTAHATGTMAQPTVMGLPFKGLPNQLDPATLTVLASQADAARRNAEALKARSEQAKARSAGIEVDGVDAPDELQDVQQVETAEASTSPKSFEEIGEIAATFTSLLTVEGVIRVSAQEGTSQVSAMHGSLGTMGVSPAVHTGQAEWDNMSTHLRAEIHSTRNLRGSSTGDIRVVMGDTRANVPTFSLKGLQDKDIRFKFSGAPLAAPAFIAPQTRQAVAA